MDEKRRNTFLAAAAAGLGAIWLMSPNRPSGRADTKETRAKTLRMLEGNLGIAGAPALVEYLTQDGFLDFKWIPAGAQTPNTLLSLGSGSGYTSWPHALDALESFNRAGGGVELEKAVEKALAGSPQGNDQASRGLVLSWLQTIAKSNAPGFQRLVSDLVAGSWVTGYKPPAPPNDIPLTLVLSIGSAPAKKIFDYPRWLREIKTDQIVDLVEPMLHPDDPTAAARYLLWTRIELASDLPGFKDFATALDTAGWNTHPFTKTVPPAGTVLPELGGLKNVDLHELFQTLTVPALSPVVDRAIHTYDPTLLARQSAMTALTAIQLDPWAPKYFVNFDTVYEALAKGGFAASPRGEGITVPGGNSTKVTVRGFVEKDVVGPGTKFATLQDFVAQAAAEDVAALATLGLRSAGPIFRRWVALQMMADPTVSVDASAPNEIAGLSAGMIEDGVFRVPAATASGGSPVRFWFNTDEGQFGGTFDTPQDIYDDPSQIDIFIQQTFRGSQSPNAGKIGGPHFLPAISERLVKGLPAIGVPGAHWGNYGVNHPG